MCGSAGTVSLRQRDANGRFASAKNDEPKGKNMIRIENSYEDNLGGKQVDEIENGTTFLGTIEDENGDDNTGVFLKVNDLPVFLDNPTVEFSAYGAVTNYRIAELTVTVDDAYPE